MVLEGSSCGRDEGTDTYHLGSEVSNESKVFLEGLQRLERRTYHESCAHLVAEVAQVLKTLHAVLEAHL